MLTLLILLAVIATILIFLSNIIFGRTKTSRNVNIFIYKICKKIPPKLITILPNWLFKKIIKNQFDMTKRTDIMKELENIDEKKLLLFKNKYAMHNYFNNKVIYLGKGNDGKYTILYCCKNPYFEKWEHHQIMDHFRVQRKLKNDVYPLFFDIVFLPRDTSDSSQKPISL